MKKINTLIITLFIVAFASAQDNSLKPTTISKAAYMIEIPALSKMENIIAAKGFEDVAPPKRRGKNTIIEGKGLPKGKDPLMQLQIEIAKSNTTRATGTTTASFAAHQGTVLNDPTGAIGPNHYVYAFNSGFGILSRTGDVLLPEASLATLFPNETLGDPIVVYDRFADRFIIMEFSNSPNGFLIAICKGPDPVNDGWYTYRFNTGTFPDYEKLAVWSDGYYITANKDQNSPQTSDVVFAVERDLMIAGNVNAQMIGFPLPNVNNSGFYSPGGFNAIGASLPPVGVGHPIVYMQDDAWTGVSQDHLKIWTVDVDWSTPSNSSISTPQTINTTDFDSVFDNGSFQNLNEPGSGSDIDALQSTMMYMTNYRRFSTHNAAVMNFVVDVSGNDTVAGIRWYELRQTEDNAPWTIYQEGTYTQPNGQSAFCGSISMDSQGNIGLGYTVVSDLIYTSLRYTGRLANDTLGTMTIAEKNIVDGDAKNNRPDGRYGDYSQLTIDPIDDLTFWHIGEYMKGAASAVRKSHVAAFKITNSGGGDNQECIAEINSFPHNEGFENTLGTWTQETGDDLNWTINSGGTSSSSTGPSSATQGTYYIYVEASGSGTGYPNKQAIINSPCYDLSLASSATFSFKYHMYGSTDIGSIALEASTDNGSTWTSIWSQTGNQGNSWQTVSLNLASYLGSSVQLRYNRITGGTWKADVAIDDVSLSTSSDGGGSNDCASAALTLTINLDNYPEETTWILKNSGGTTVAFNAYSSSNPDGSTVVENINDLSSGDYTFTINDSVGDGICCGYGNGSYTLSSSEGVIASGGDFGSSEVIDFCVDSTKQQLNTYELNKEKIFTIYPNPVQNTFKIDSNEQEINQVLIFSVLGKKISEFSSNEANSNIDVSKLATGNYYIRIVSGDSIITKKFIKK
ncbi:MAG: T9SS type A sorting domain-containing protein [Flavobacteriaceae bacterium]|nr:T9SS type A sorting domain-containing protein [Flavobacteriaceae bacterium]